MNIKNIVHDIDYLNQKGYSVENNIIESIDINIIAHFGNVTCLTIMCTNICPYATYNNTGNLGYLIKGIIELFDLSQEDGIRLSKLKDIPCRLVFGNSNNVHIGDRAIGIGHYMKDKYIIFDEFSKLGMEDTNHANP